MYDKTTASSGLIDMSSESGSLRRAMNYSGVMPASSSSMQSAYTNSNMGTSTVQPENLANAQAYPMFDDTSPHVPQPESSINSHSTYDTGRGRFQRGTYPVNAYQSSDTPTHSLAVQSYLPARSSICVANTYGIVSCLCPVHVSSTIGDNLFGAFNPASQGLTPSNQAYGLSPGPASVSQTFPYTTRSLNTPQSSSYVSYDLADSGISHYNSSFQSSAQHLYADSSANIGSSSIHIPIDSHGTGFSSIDQGYQSTFPDMRNVYPPNSSVGQALPFVDQPHHQSTRPKAPSKSFSGRREDEIPIKWSEFLKVQRLLDTESESPPTAKSNEQYAAFLEMPISQVDFCMAARLQLYPHIKNVVLSSASLGFPADLAIRWYQEIESSNRASRVQEDSAYQSGVKTAKDPDQTKRKRKRSRTDANGQKMFQCTHIKPDGTYCLQENVHFADWKRHEETHWPQKRWECLIDGSHRNVNCHICGRHIDLAGQTTITHGDCLNRIVRRGHDFHRKDKLIKHAKEVHRCEANVESWYTDIFSNWKRQCGFCGDRFNDWDTRCAHVSVHFASGLRMETDWRDPWPEVDQNNDQRPDEDDDEDDNEDDNDDDRGSHGNENTHQSHFGNDNSNSRSGNNPSNAPGRDNGNTKRRPPRDSNGKSKEFQTDGMITEPLDETTDDNEQCQQQDLALQIAAPPPCLAPTKPPPSQTTIVGFEFVRKLGYGAFGTVDEVLHRGTKTYFARKSIRTTLQHSVPALAQARREVVALCNLRHVHIVGVVAYYTLEDQVSIIMSPVAEGNLSEYMLGDQSAPLIKSSNLSKWMGCLTSAVSYMHKKSWQHLDIKPSNVLVTGGHVMLSDFGGALLMDGSRPKASMGNSCAVTPMYCAPELANKSQKPILPGASDIYSLGCVFLEMATVIHRQSLKSFESLRKLKTGDGSYHNNFSKTWIWIQYLMDSDEVLGLAQQHGLQIITGMLSDDPRKRPTARYIEQSYHYFHLSRSQQEDKQIEEEKFLIITTAETKNRFFPMEIARRWLANCMKNHKSCSRPAKDFFPSRILNVGTNSNFIHLQSSNDSPRPYATLSHCWGAGEFLKTTTKTLRAMTQGIEISSLSSAFSDAVRITRALGLKYLWIDSLCILQDHHEDWVSQSSQMHNIYSHSSLTICLASDGNSGFSGNRPLTETSTSGDSNPGCLTCSKGYNEFEHLSDDTPTTMLLDSPWSKRGWTLQERILSPRVLYYSSTRMAWECGGNRSILDIVGQMRESLKMLSINKTVAPNRKRCWDSPLTKPSQEFNKLWRATVKEYTKRHLSRPQDKLPALAGIASEIASLSGQKYLAGLWNDDLIHSLLWCRDFATTPLPPPLEYRAPSWSWAAIDSPVTWSKAMLDFPDDEEAKVLSCHVTPESRISPFGQVASGGSLRIQGSMQRVLVGRSQPHNILDVETRMPFAFAQWDSLDPRHHYGKPRSNFNEGFDELWCLRILGGAGLLLEKKEAATDTFQRVGVYRIHESRDGEPGLDRAQRGDVRSILIV